MGNRAVITTKYNFENNGVGVYLHWNGGRDSVEPFLAYCKLKGYRDPAKDNYGWARLCQVIGNALGGTNSVGIDTIDHLDCDNWDNGVYIIDNWEIVDRKFFDGVEQNHYDFEQMLIDIDASMPESEQIGEDIIRNLIKSKNTPYLDKVHSVHVGSTVCVYDDLHDKWITTEILGFGDDGAVVNGHDVGGIPFFDFLKDSPYVSDVDPKANEFERLKKNSNSYLFDTKKWFVM